MSSVDLGKLFSILGFKGWILIETKVKITSTLLLWLGIFLLSSSQSAPFVSSTAWRIVHICCWIITRSNWMVSDRQLVPTNPLLSELMCACQVCITPAWLHFRWGLNSWIGEDLYRLSSETISRELLLWKLFKVRYRTLLTNTANN